MSVRYVAIVNFGSPLIQLKFESVYKKTHEKAKNVCCAKSFRRLSFEKKCVAKMLNTAKQQHHFELVR